jgi:type IV secretion system protein VirB3
MEPLEEVRLAVADTRPPMIAGLAVPLQMGVLLLTARGLIIIFGHNPLFELLLVPLWLGAREVIKYDYNATGIIFLWLATAAKSLDAHFWGGASPAPFPVRRGRLPRGIL